MQISKGQIFNLWDTNGRRSDVLNAIFLYLNILKDHKERYSEDAWATYPKSLAQYRFYEDAITMSPDVFQKHKNRDKFISWISDKENLFFSQDVDWYIKEMQTCRADNKTYAEILDESIEQRARHYTSNLVRWGFANEDRDITQAGYAFLFSNIKRDRTEVLLPIDNTNLTLLRQAAKLRIYSNTANENGKYNYYSPFYMALFLLLKNNERYSTNEFRTIVQQTSPFYKDRYSLSEIVSGEALLSEINQSVIPNEIHINSVLPETVFKKFFPNTKSNSIVSLYYNFYTLLSKIIISKDRKAAANLVVLCSDVKNNSKLEQAFGGGEKILSLTSQTSLEQILLQLKEKDFLCVNTQSELNIQMYKTFLRSKIIDQAREYSDTTIRMLNATGIFRFSNMPEVNFPAVIKTIFGNNLENHIFGESSLEELNNHEQLFHQNISLQEILNISTNDVQDYVNQLCKEYNVRADELSIVLKDQRNEELIKHIKEKYPKNKVQELVGLFSDRRNDNQIKEFVNPSATIPTIFEFIIALSWFYISENPFDLYNSMNLSLNGDYEPELHAGGGAGDIVIQQEEKITMLEVTLMNRQAQKRGEWEPVLRHAVNLSVDMAPTPVTTLFVADELDYNTINIWRAVASVPLESSTTRERTNHVVIMPLKIEEIVKFLQNNVTDEKIISSIQKSYHSISCNFDDEWRNKIMNNILPECKKLKTKKSHLDNTTKGVKNKKSSNITS